MIGTPWYLWVLAGLAAALGFWARAAISNTYRKFSKLRTSAWVNTSRLASDLIAQAQVGPIGIELISGTMMDHYNPWRKKICISDPTSNSLADFGIIALEAGHAIQHARHSPLFFIYWGISMIARPISWAAIIAIVLGILRYIPLFIFWMLDPRILSFGLWAYTGAVFATAVTVLAKLDARWIALKYLSQLSDAQPSPQDIQALQKVLRIMTLRDLAEVASGLGALQSLQNLFSRK